MEYGVYTPASVRYLFLFTIHPVSLSEIHYQLDTIPLHHEKSMLEIILTSILEEKFKYYFTLKIDETCHKIVLKRRACKQVLIVTGCDPVFSGAFDTKHYLFCHYF